MSVLMARESGIQEKWREPGSLKGSTEDQDGLSPFTIYAEVCYDLDEDRPSAFPARHETVNWGRSLF